MAPAMDGSIPPIASTPAAGSVASNSQSAQSLQSAQGLNLSSAQIVVGKQFQGEVLSRLTDGSFVVKVADVAARMQLPAGVQVGAKLPLTLISMTPRATFLLEKDGQEHTATAVLGSSQDDQFIPSSDPKNTAPGIAFYQRSGAGMSASANPGTATSAGLNLMSASASPSASPSAGASAGASAAATASTNAVSAGTTSDPRGTALTNTPDSAPASFSSAGKLINQLLQNSAGQNTVATSKIPLLTGPEMDTGVLSQALKNGVTHSGVFYESHLVQWADGNRSVDQIMKEPQAQFGSHMAANTAANTTANTTANTAANSPASATVPATTLFSSANALSGTTANTTASGTGSTITDPSSLATSISNSPEASKLIGQQLQTLEQNSFSWQGQLWPGQTLELHIKRDAPGGGGNQQEPTWSSTVRFELPQLGTITGKLYLAGEHLQIRLQTDTEATANALQQNAADLASALAGSGAELDSLLVRTTEATGDSGNPAPSTTPSFS